MAGLFRGENGQSDFGFAALALGFALTLLALAGVVIEYESPAEGPEIAPVAHSGALPPRPSSTQPETMVTTPPVSDAATSGVTRSAPPIIPEPTRFPPPRVFPTIGRVYLPGGDAAAGAWVTVRESGDHHPIAEATADERGAFSINGDFRDLSLVICATHPRAHAVEKTITRHPGPDGIDLGSLELNPQRDLVINLRDERGSRLAGITVRLISKHNQPAQEFEERTDEDGDAVFVNLRDRSYRVEIRSLRWPTHLADLELESEDYDYPERHVFEIKQGTQQLRGKVLSASGMPIAGAKVMARSLQEGMTIQVEGASREDGSFELPSVPEAFYQLHCEHVDFVQQSKGSKIIELGDEPEIRMVAAGRLRGVLQTDKPLPPVAHFRVWSVSGSDLRETPHAWSNVPRNAWTPFEIPAIAPGQYVLEARAPGYQPSVTEPFEITAGETFDQTNVTLLRASIVTGKVVDAHGKEARGARVSLVPETRESEWFQGKILEASTDESGRYRIDSVPGGRYGLTISAPGHSQLTRNNVVIPAGEMRHLGTQSLSVGGLIRVSVRLRDGRPVPRMRVMIQAVADGQESYFETSATGMLQSLPLSPGVYKVALAPLDAESPFPPEEALVKDGGITTVGLIWAGGRL